MPQVETTSPPNLFYFFLLFTQILFLAFVLCPCLLPSL